MFAGSDSVAFVHIGTHKTGSTSFQRWASQNCAELARATGLAYYEGLFGPSHYEIPMLCMRADRNMPERVWRPRWCRPGWQRKAERHIRDQAARDVHSLLISAEALSYTRHPDEVARLIALLKPRQITAIAVLRKPSSFLRSYREAMLEQGFPPSPHRQSFAYVADDSWLVDYDALLGVYRQMLGADHVVALDYERELQRYGSIIPAILEAIGFDHAQAPGWEDFRLNVSGSALLNRLRRSALLKGLRRPSRRQR